MALVKQTLETQLVAYFKDNNKTPEKAASELATIIDGYIRNATVATTVVGTSATGGPVTGTGTGGLS